jgi:antirestriction protein ArdC
MGDIQQWQKVGAQVQGGEKGTAGIKWGFTFTCGTTGKKGSYACKIDGCQDSKFVWGSTFTVFNADQVDGYDVEVAEKPESVVDRDARADAFIAGTGASFTYKGASAHYTPGTNNIVLPPVEDFKSTEGFYATALHELTHWSGDKSRLDRDQQNIFGSQAYAAEELVAEFGSAFLQAHLGLAAEPSLNAAAYLKNWATVLRADEKNLYRAAKYATAAAKFMIANDEKAEVNA